MQTIAIGSLELETVAPIVMLPRKRIRPFVGQPREYFDPVKLEELADSMVEEGQKVPVEVRLVNGDPDHNFELVDGQRRWHAAEMRGIELLKGWINLTIVDEEDQFVNSIVSNFVREPHTPLEIAHAVARLLKSTKKKRTYNEIARMFGRSVGWVRYHHDLLKLAPEVHGLMSPTVDEDNRLTVTPASLLTGLPEELQIKFAKRFVFDGTSLLQARYQVRQTAAELEEDSQRTGPRKRRPSDYYESLRNFTKRLGEESEVLLETPLPLFRQMMGARTVRERTQLLVAVDTCLENLEQLKQILDDVNKDLPLG